jgi:hypothetical protein
MVDVDSNNLFALGPLLNLLGTRLHLPLRRCGQWHGHADRHPVRRQSTQGHHQVDSSVLRACVGNVDPAQRFSKSNVCDATLQNEQLLKLLGQPLINDRITLPALTSSQNLTLAAGETGSTRINPLAIGDAVSSLVNELLRVLSGMLSSPKQGMSANDTAKALADRYLQAFRRRTLQRRPGFHCCAMAIPAGNWHRSTAGP